MSFVQDMSLRRKDRLSPDEKRERVRVSLSLSLSTFWMQHLPFAPYGLEAARKPVCWSSHHLIPFGTTKTYSSSPRYPGCKHIQAHLQHLWPYLELASTTGGKNFTITFLNCMEITFSWDLLQCCIRIAAGLKAELWIFFFPTIILTRTSVSIIKWFFYI